MVMAVLYVLICRKLWPRKIPENVSGKSRAVVEMSKRKVVRLLIAIIVVFAFCWFPTYVNHYFLIIRPEQGHKLPAEVQHVLFWLAHANSAINPCLYVLLNYNFRKRLVSMLVRCLYPRCFCCTPKNKPKKKKKKKKQFTKKSNIRSTDITYFDWQAGSKGTPIIGCEVASKNKLSSFSSKILSRQSGD